VLIVVAQQNTVRPTMTLLDQIAPTGQLSVLAQTASAAGACWTTGTALATGATDSAAVMAPNVTTVIAVAINNLSFMYSPLVVVY
jgi:hypothetical protein